MTNLGYLNDATIPNKKCNICNRYMCNLTLSCSSDPNLKYCNCYDYEGVSKIETSSSFNVICNDEKCNCDNSKKIDAIFKIVNDRNVPGKLRIKLIKQVLKE